ncbi:MAG TPA: glycosyltransferase family 4 protein [Pyrinomonadaceae bacterium]|nr:glycosyltransferase family 4 protein [Pyrinomonadaceae bacterium]
MFLFHTIPYVRNQNDFNIADQYGAWVGHQDLIRAVLKYGSLEGIHFFLPFQRHSQEELARGLEELRRDFPTQRIETRRLIDLQELAKEYRYVLADDFEMFTSLALSRHVDGQCLFPLCNIVHTIPQYTALMGYLSTMLLAEPFDAIVATSEAANNAIKSIFEELTEFVRSRWKIKIPRVIKPTRIPMGIDDEFLRPYDSKAARSTLNLPSDTINILYLGRLSEGFKADLEPLLTVFSRLAVEDSNLRLVVAGQDVQNKYSSNLRSLAEQFGIGEQLIIRTNFPFSQKPLFYSACDIFVSPVDNIQETFGLSILEAMACGLPVIASDWSGYRDLVVHGETGFLVSTIWNGAATRLAELAAPLRNSTTAGHYLAQQTVVDGEELLKYLRLLLDNPDLRKQFGEKGRERVAARFSWPVVVKQYEEVWREQWLQLDRIDRRTELHLPLNYNKQFGHFATRFLDGEVVLKASAHRSSEGAFSIGDNGLPYAVKLEDIQQVISQCQVRPRSISELSASGNSSILNAATWLWKKGYLETV